MKYAASEQINIPAIRERELVEILTAYRLDQAVTAGSASCECCGKPVGWPELAALIVKENGLGVICSRPGCVEKAATQDCG